MSVYYVQYICTVHLENYCTDTKTVTQYLFSEINDYIFFNSFVIIIVVITESYGGTILVLFESALRIKFTRSHTELSLQMYFCR